MPQRALWLVLRSQFQEGSLVNIMLPPDSMIISIMKLYKIGAESPIWSGSHSYHTQDKYLWATNGLPLTLEQYFFQSIVLQGGMVGHRHPLPCMSFYLNTRWSPTFPHTAASKGWWYTKWDCATTTTPHPCALPTLINVVILCSPRSLSNHVGRGTDRPCTNWTAPLAQPGPLLSPGSYEWTSRV